MEQGKNNTRMWQENREYILVRESKETEELLNVDMSESEKRNHEEKGGVRKKGVHLLLEPPGRCDARDNQGTGIELTIHKERVREGGSSAKTQPTGATLQERIPC